MHQVHTFFVPVATKTEGTACTGTTKNKAAQSLISTRRSCWSRNKHKCVADIRHKSRRGSVTLEKRGSSSSTPAENNQSPATEVVWRTIVGTHQAEPLRFDPPHFNSCVLFSSVAFAPEVFKLILPRFSLPQA